MIIVYNSEILCSESNSDIAEMIKRKGFAKERIRADAAEPKSNDDLRRLGISHLLPSVKGKDSIMNGIQKINEYHIYVHPKCVNTVKELSSYRYEVDKSDNGLNKPIDFDNHLMDAMRYAMQDLRGFGDVKISQRKSRTGLVSADDFKGGWK